MSHRSYFLSIPFFFILILLPLYALALQGKLIDIIGRDSITVLQGNDEIEFRLYGLDTPEHDQPFGTKSTNFTSKISSGKKLELKCIDIYPSGRTVDLVHTEVNEECLNNEIIIKNVYLLHLKFQIVIYL